MARIIKIPLFPLGILPIPQELIPLHIFESRYRELLEDVQHSEDKTFGILFDHPLNKDHLGAIVTLESILKEYDTGETDIVVQCQSNFILNNFYSKYNQRLYPGGEVFDLQNESSTRAKDPLKHYFQKYLQERDKKPGKKNYYLHEIANMLHLEVHDRISYIKSNDTHKRESFLQRLIKYHFFLLEQENKSRSKFYLN